MKFKKIARQPHLLIPNITAVIYSNLFLDIGIWCILCIFNTVPCAEYNFVRKNRKRLKFGSAESEAVHIPYLHSSLYPSKSVQWSLRYIYVCIGCIGCICNGDSCVDLIKFKKIVC